MNYKELFFTLIALTLLLSYSYADSNGEEGTLTKVYLVTLEEGANQDLAASYGTIIYRFNIVNAVAVELTDEALAQLSQDPAVLLIEENQTYTLEETETEPLIQKTLGGDLVTLGGDSASQWNLGETGINAEAAWNNFPADGTGVKIAIIDTGVNYNHELLDGTKYLGGKDYCQERTPTCVEDPLDNPMDEYGHGTMMATAMLASGENDSLKGISPQAEYYAVKVTDANATWGIFAVLAGFDWAVEQEVDIIYIGLRSGSISFSLENAINNAFANGILVVAPNFETYEYPGRYDNTIGVGAHDNEVPQNVINTGDYTEVVAPGKDVPVIGKSGSDWIETTDNDPDVAAAQVAGALALMIDYNRTQDLGYDNQALWDTLNYSAIDWVNPLAGNGKADVNAALSWMENEWFIEKAVNYIEPDELGYPPVYYYENSFDYEVEITNNSDENFYYLTVTAKAVYLEGTQDGQEVEEIDTFVDTSIEFLGTGQTATVSPPAIDLLTSIEPGLKGILVEVKVGEEGVPVGGVIAFSELSNGWILTTGPEEGILHLTEMPWYEKEQTYYSGAATAQMILNFVRQAAGYPTLTQDEIYAYGGGIPTNDLDADAMDAVLGHYDPYDNIVSNYYDIYDSEPDGNPYQGYNYTVDTHDNVNDYMKNIAHWMGYTVTEEAWWIAPQTLVAEPNTPAALPLYGNYNKWVALNGYAASDNPAPDPFVNPWYVPDITMFGFWVTDPTADGIGEHFYVTAAEAEATYFLPMSTGDDYNGLYMQIAEPPPMPSEEEYRMPKMKNGNVEIARPHADLGNLDFVGAEAIQPEFEMAGMGGTGMMVMATSYGGGMEADWGIVEPKTSWRDLVDEYLLQDEEAVAAFDGAQIQKPVLVQRLDDGSSYYLVAFNKAKEGRYRRWFNRFNQKTSGVIVLDAEDGHFNQAAWTAEPEEYLPITENKAKYLVWKEAGKSMRSCLQEARKEYYSCRAECNGLERKERTVCRRECSKEYTQLRKECYNIRMPKEAELVWQAGDYSQSPFQPYWIVNMNGQEWVVTQEGLVERLS